MDAYVATIEDGFQEFGIANDSILIGNGFGGTVALAFALAHPERISKLLLSDAAACFPDEGRKQFEAMAAKVSEGGLGAIAEIAAKRVFSPAYLASHPEAIEERKAVLLEIDPKAFQAACKILQEADLEPLLHRLKMPTLVVCGEFDQATPPPLNKAIADKVAGALLMWNCRAAAIARRWSSRRRSWRRSRILWGSDSCPGCGAARAKRSQLHRWPGTRVHFCGRSAGSRLPAHHLRATDRQR